MTEVKNRDLYNGTVSDDRLFVLSRKPRHTSDGWEIEVALGDGAAVLDRYTGDFPENCTVGEARHGEARCKGLWLLSGGSLIRDNAGRIAIGLRDGNAADPFIYTNIGAGRCDRPLIDTCWNEITTEFVLCVKINGHWRQVQLHPDHTPPPLQQVRAERPAIANWQPHVVPEAELLDFRRSIELPKTRDGVERVRVRWLDGDDMVHAEDLAGHAYLDEANRTLEFRMAVNIDLHGCEDSAIFFAEGTGFAGWKTLDEVRGLATLGMVTPFLTSYVTGRKRRTGETAQ